MANSISTWHGLIQITATKLMGKITDGIADTIGYECNAVDSISFPTTSMEIFDGSLIVHEN